MWGHNKHKDVYVSFFFSVPLGTGITWILLAVGRGDTVLMIISIVLILIGLFTYWKYIK